jgi:replicative DNA helicase
LSELHERGANWKPADVAAELTRNKQLGAYGFSELVDMANVSLTDAVLVTQCETIRRTAIRRRAIQGVAALLEDLYGNDTSEDTLVCAERVSNILSTVSRRLKARTLNEVIADSGGINEFLSPHKRPGIEIPFPEINEALGGLRHGKLLLLASRPAVGKSAWVHEITLHAAQNCKRVLLVTLEMTATDVLHREIAGRAEVSAYRFRTGSLEQDERERVHSRTVELIEFAGESVRFMDQTEADVNAVRSLVRSLKAKEDGPDLVVIDYLQLRNGQGETREQEIAGICKGIKVGVCQAFDIPVIAICSLSRKGANETDEPSMLWLRDSGQLEYHADQVVFFWPKKAADEDEVIREVYWKIAKNKDGREARGLLQFHRKHCNFIEPRSSFQQRSTLKPNGGCRSFCESDNAPAAYPD